MRKLTFKHSLSVPVLLGLLFIVSCQKSEDSANDARDKFTGSWQVKESGKNAQPNPYSITISKSDSSSIQISNFANLGKSVFAKGLVSGSSLSFNTQTLDKGFTLYNGVGSISGNKLNMSYRLETDDITADCTRQ